MPTPEQEPEQTLFRLESSLSQSTEPDPQAQGAAQTPSGSPAAAADSSPEASAGSNPGADADSDRLASSDSIEIDRSQEALGQSPQSPGLSLSQALDIGWKTNPRVLEAEQALLATDYDVKGAWTGFFPFLQVDTQQDARIGNSSTVRVVQPLWRGGRTTADIAAAKAGQQAALAELNRARLEVAQNVVTAYLGVATAQDEVLQWYRYGQQLESLSGVIRRRAEQGLEPDADVQSVITRQKQADAQAQAALSRLVSRRADLAALIFVMPDEVSWPDETTLLNEFELDHGLEQALLAHPDRQAAEALIQQQTAAARQSKAQIFPEVQLQYRHQLSSAFNDFEPDDQTLLVMGYQSDNGLRALRAWQAEKQRLQAARERLRTAYRTVTASIRSLIAQRNAARLQVGVQQIAVDSADGLVESFLRQFAAGRKRWLEVLNAQRDANQVALELVAIRQSYWAANAQLALQMMYWKRLSPNAPLIDSMPLEHAE